MTIRWWAGLAVLAAGLALAVEPGPAKVPSVNTKHSLEVATLGGGCFWCLEAVFERLPGVTNVVSGYSGGHDENPTYRAVCEGTTGHAEVVQIQFDPAVIPYERILEVFWQAHDPTTANRQGGDVGTQYRSIILTHSPEQAAFAERSKAIANAGRYDGKIVTEIVPLKKFHKAEDYHQDYFRNHPGQPYCQAVIAPKLFKLEQHGTVPKR